MHQAIGDLLSVSGETICEPFDMKDELIKWGRCGKELANILRAKNGFYAYEKSLLLRPFSSAVAPLGVIEWNDPGLWKTSYLLDLSGILFFAEDVFGCQYYIDSNGVGAFDPETGTAQAMCESLEEWAQAVISDCNFRTGLSLANEWQLANGGLLKGMRLLPKRPFVFGGQFELSNLYLLSDVEGMLFRASIANQIRNVPDGKQIIFKLK